MATTSGAHWLAGNDGSWIRLPTDRWHATAEPALRAVLRRCGGPTLDVGCGPGRVTRALMAAGVTTVGVDVCAEAVRRTRARGAVALRRDVFDPLPGEGRWGHALLIDGNIGIGGDPAALLRRCRELVHPHGTILVEVEPSGPGLWRGESHVAYRTTDGVLRCGPWFRWARLDQLALPGVAATVGLVVRDLLDRDGRWFGVLGRS
ncbi:class I SAM-dependent methyltransferase [Micromonospora sp. WMMA1363]|uniref:class I SAM-dependent methyltransferase n=1 Tax=Micromonospora sp. WMMA1363 TaxID=3053985 RepID=UPI00259CC3ED|nr:class I SAM-dependent methyltransferase [Micromonospora sp. WMMA1363]MDM4719236.1 class I SAM-dependent methyltransferase [Micromonospora sp. WMMA1363]